MATGCISLRPTHKRQTPATGTVFTATYRIGNGTGGQRGSRQSNELCRRRACRLSNQFLHESAAGERRHRSGNERANLPPRSASIFTQERAVTMQDM